MTDIYDKFHLNLIYHPGSSAHLYQILVFTTNFNIFIYWELILYEWNIY